jgi:anthranilate synthase component 1
MPQVFPAFEEFARLAEQATVVPIHREVLADALTPVVAKATVGSGPGSFLLESVVGGEKWGRYSFVGFEPSLIVRGVADRFELVSPEGVKEELGVDPWQRLREVLSAYRPPDVPWLPRFWGGAVGYAAYESVRRFEPTVGAKLERDDPWELCFGIGATVLVFDAQRQTMKVVVPVIIEEGEDLRALYAAATARIDRALERLEAPARLRPLAPPDPAEHEPLPASSFDRETFYEAVGKVKAHIGRGDIFQLVLSQRFRVPAEDIDLYDVYRAMRTLNPSPYMYFLDFDDVAIAGASPETLVRLEDGVTTVRPIAGTRRRGKDEADDQAIAEELLADPKELAEHVMLVDLGRNDVGRISQPGTVRLTEQMAIERYSHVMHIVSNVEGDVQAGQDALDVLRATFPAGTLSGAPKVRAMQLIDELEPVRRGVYGGAIGYIGFDGNMDVAIAIRTVVAREGELWLQAGAGIVEMSDPESEYDETVNKARAGLVAVAAGRRKP